MLHYPFIKVSGSTYYEIGKDYGYQTKKLIAHALMHYKQVLTAKSNRSWEELQQFALSFLDITRKLTPEVMEEVEGIAEGSGFPLADIMVVNCRYEIMKFPRKNECTTAAVLPEVTKNGTMYLIKNWDNCVGIMDHVIIIHITQPDGTRIMGLTEAGQVIRGGMNNYGLGAACNSLQSIYDAWAVGLPTVFVRRELLKCKTFEEAKKFVLGYPRTVSNNMMVVGFNEKKAVDFEVYPHGVDIIEPVKGILTHANHFTVQQKLQVLPSSPRGKRLQELLLQKHGTIDVNYIKYCMADHVNYPQALCRHPNDPIQPLEMRLITVSNEIMDFEAGVVHVCAGPPCSGEYCTYVL